MAQAAQTITVIDKATKASATVTGQEVTLTAPSVVELPVPHDQIKSMTRKGGDLVVTTADGHTIVIHGYFTDGAAAANSLVTQDSGNALSLADLNSMNAATGDGASIDPSAGSTFSSIDSIDPLLGDPQSDPNWLPIPLAVGGFATALAVAAGLGGGGGGGTPNPPNAPGVSVAPNSDGTITASGNATPGNTVNVTFPDHSSGSAAAGADGSYSVPSSTVQTSGTVAATDTDPNSGLTSAPTDVQYTDTTPPLPPVVHTQGNSDGTLTVSGTAEPGSTVTVTYPDGTVGSTSADANGNYTITSPTVQTSGEVQ
ncbi:MAG: BapA prefix-like domain-containing protein, partial [Burkholderiaceae bacterium]|nr:BapA prefix-like domain-containing protein [Burkholderiaceae bacterium]